MKKCYNDKVLPYVLCIRAWRTQAGVDKGKGKLIILSHVVR